MIRYLNMCLSAKCREFHVACSSRLHDESLPVLCLIGHQLEEALGHLSHAETSRFINMCNRVVENNCSITSGKLLWLTLAL